MTRHGQPRKTSAPMAATMPSSRRTMGEEPPRARYSPQSSEAPSAPSTMPRISGRRYWTMAARCRPMAPAMSRLKQATQMPMLPGLPMRCSRMASAPRTSPVQTTPVVVEKKLEPVFMKPPCEADDTRQRTRLRASRVKARRGRKTGQRRGGGASLAAVRRRFRPKTLHTVERRLGRQLRYDGIALPPPKMSALPLSWGSGERSLGKPGGKVKEDDGKRRPRGGVSSGRSDSAAGLGGCGCRRDRRYGRPWRRRW